MPLGATPDRELRRLSAPPPLNLRRPKVEPPSPAEPAPEPEKPVGPFRLTAPGAPLPPGQVTPEYQPYEHTAWSPLDDLSTQDRERYATNPQFAVRVHRAARKNFVDFKMWWDSLYDQVTGLPPNPIESPKPINPADDGYLIKPDIGAPEDLLDSSTNVYTVLKNLEKYKAGYKEHDPDGYNYLDKSKTGMTRATPTLDPLRALWAALEQVQDEHEETYTQYIGTTAGYADLMMRSLMEMMNPSKKELSILPFSEGVPGMMLSDYIERTMPDVPILKRSLMHAAEIFGDPGALALTAAFPPAGIAAKTALLGEIAGGMAVGEELAEQVGVPTPIGGLIGSLAGPGLAGFTRASIRNAIANARHRPTFGEPATEALRVGGELFTPAQIDEMTGQSLLARLPKRTLQNVERGDDVFYSAHYADEAELVLRGSTREGQVWTSRDPTRIMIPGELDDQVLTFRARPGAKPKFESQPGQPDAVAWAPEDLIPVSRMGITDVFPKDMIQRATPAARTPSGVLPPMGGGAMGGPPDLADMDFLLQATVTSPTAQNLLRRTINWMADTIPGSRRAAEMVNRAALDDPHVKGAFGWHLMKNVDDAQRFQDVGRFRGRRPPFPENAKGQFWLPKVAGQKSNIFFRSNGDWIAIGDVMEGVARRDKALLRRITPEQKATIDEAIDVFNQYVRAAEKSTGLKITKKDFWWPRFVRDPAKKGWQIGARRGGKPPALFERQYEVQNEAIEKFGIRYKPGFFNQMDMGIESMQRLNRDAVFGKYLKREGLLRGGKHRLAEIPASVIGPTVRGNINKDVLREIMEMIGPGTTNPVVTAADRLNSIARLMLTGTMDTGWGALQLLSLHALPAGPIRGLPKPLAQLLSPVRGQAIWSEAMGRSFWNMIVEPKQFWRFLTNSPAARNYALYGGDVGVSTELFEGLQFTRPRIPVVEPVAGPLIDIATWPARAFLNRMQTGFGTALAYGRILAFDAMSQVATKPGRLRQALGAPGQLSGAALHEEMFRLARFTDTLIGQPKLGGIISTRQHQLESGFVWFATRYTRSFLGTASYALGAGYTAAEARVIMSKMLLGGSAIMAGLVAAQGKATGKSDEQIQKDIVTALNPASGKKFMSLKIGDVWWGLGGVQRAGIALIGGLADKDNWDFESWEEGLWENPIVRGWRSRAAPITTRAIELGPSLVGYLTGNQNVEMTDYLGYSVNFSDMVDDPRILGDYASDNFAPIALDAFLQGHGTWEQRTPAAIAEFFGLRTSPETAWEALEPVMDRVSMQKFGLTWEELADNMPAQDFVRNHSDVIAVTEGLVRPRRQRPEERMWDKYRAGKDSVRYKFALEKVDLDDSVIGGRMDGETYRENWADIQAREFHEMLGLRESMGITFDEEAKPGTVDHALNEYFAIDLKDYTDPVSQEKDWEGYFSARDAVLERVPEKYKGLVEEWLHRRETPLRRNFRATFESIIEPSGYLQMRENTALSMGLDLDDIEALVLRDLQKGGARASPLDVNKVVDNFLDDMLADFFGEDPTTRERESPRMADLRGMMRETNPFLDLELFRQGFTTTVRSEAAIELAYEYMRSQPTLGYFIPELAEDVEEALERKRKKK